MSCSVHDRDGNGLRVGDVVRVLGVPDLAGMAAEARRETEPVFRSVVGTYKRVAGFQDVSDTETLVELAFRIRRDGQWQRHIVWIEPALLRKKRSRGTLSGG
jgi:hypothetical protein